MSREMKITEVGWIGKIPLDWNTQKIKRVFYIISGNGFPVQLQGRTNEMYPFAKAGTISSSSRYLRKADDTVSIKDIKSNGFNIIPTGSIVLPKIGEALKKNSRAITTQKCCIDNNCQAMVPKKLNGIYAYYLLSVIDMNWFDNKGTIPSINNQALKSETIPYPSYNEQRQIVSFLDRKCSAIDTAIEKTKKSIEKLEEYKKAVITKAVTKGLDPDAKMKDSGVEWIGEVPEGWEVKRLRMFYGRRIHKNKGLQEKNLLSLSYGNVIRKSIDTKEGLLPESFDGYNIVEKGDIVIRGTDLQNDHRSLRTGLVTERGIITSAYMTLMPVSSEANSEYFHYLLHCYDVEKVFYAMGGGLRQGLDFWEFSRMMVIEPPKAEQDAIVQYINDKCRAIDALIKEKQTVIDKWTEYKKSLIYYAITGKIDCRNEVCE